MKSITYCPLKNGYDVALNFKFQMVVWTGHNQAAKMLPLLAKSKYQIRAFWADFKRLSLLTINLKFQKVIATDKIFLMHSPYYTFSPLQTLSL